MPKTKQAKTSDGGLSAFASAIAPILNPKLQVHQIYASAFEDAVSQINASLQPAGSLVASIRARSAELAELADLIETTLAAKEGAAVSAEDEGAQENATDEGKPEDKSSRPVSGEGA